MGVSSNPRYLTIQRTFHSISITQPAAGTYNLSSFEFLLRSVRFAHDPARPPVSRYSARVLVTASDSLLTSQPAATRIDVSIANFSPVVFIEGRTSATVEMGDGQTVVQLLRAAQQTTVLEDTAVINSVSIILTNPIGESESITIDPSSLPATITVVETGVSILLIGPATPAEFTSALTSVILNYTYPAMESILQGDTPNFTRR